MNFITLFHNGNMQLHHILTNICQHDSIKNMTQSKHDSIKTCMTSIMNNIIKHIHVWQNHKRYQLYSLRAKCKNVFHYHSPYCTNLMYSIMKNLCRIHTVNRNDKLKHQKHIFKTKCIDAKIIQQLNPKLSVQGTLTNFHKS